MGDYSVPGLVVNMGILVIMTHYSGRYGQKTNKDQNKAFSDSDKW